MPGGNSRRLTPLFTAFMVIACGNDGGGEAVMDVAWDEAEDPAPATDHAWGIDVSDAKQPVDAGWDPGMNKDFGFDPAGDTGGDDATDTWINPCPRLPGPDDYPRKAVISKPFDAAGGKSGTYEVLDLAVDGTLTRPGLEFGMGRMSMGEIAFTPDGEVGIAPQSEDGTLGVFKVGPAGAVEVVHSGFDGGFYAADVVMGPDGVRAFVLDTNWRNNGGGVYSVRIECDGSLTAEGLVAPAKLPRALLFLAGDRAVVASDDILDSAAGFDTHMLEWSGGPSVLSGVSAFGDDEAMVASAAVTPDDRYALLGDGSFFSSVPNRVAVVEIEGDSLVATQVITPVDDPVAIVASPYGNGVVAVSGYSNAVFYLSYDPNDASEPFSWVGEPTYVGPPPQLPGGAVAIERGKLKGLVLVPEVGGVGRFWFSSGGGVTDIGRLSLGSGTQNNAGGIGVQP